jgi:hypothetical protein
MRSLALVFAVSAALSLPAAPALAGGDWAWPVRGQVLTEFRNGDDPYAAGQHRGVDIAAPIGTPVVAAAAGTVAFAGTVGSSGLVVSERTVDDRYELSYLHLSATSVRRGDAVDRGDRLGSVGVSGARSAEQPHLHFGVRETGDRHAYLDPLTFLAPPPAHAPEPRVAPVRVREPVAAPPAGASVPVPAPVTAPGMPVAAPHPARHPARAAQPVPHGPAAVAPAIAAHPAPLHAPAARTRSGATGARPAPHPRAAAPPHLAPQPLHGLAAAPVPGAATPVHAAAHASRHGGVDLGWLAACVGLLLAATLLAAPVRRAGGRRPSARAAFGALIRAASRPEPGAPPVAFDKRWRTTSQPRSTT